MFSVKLIFPKISIKYIFFKSVVAYAKAAPDNSQHMYEINERCVRSSHRHHVTRGMPRKQRGPVVNMVFTAQWLPRDLCRSRAGWGSTLPMTTHLHTPRNRAGPEEEGSM